MDAEMGVMPVGVGSIVFLPPGAFRAAAGCVPPEPEAGIAGAHRLPILVQGHKAAAEVFPVVGIPVKGGQQVVPFLYTDGYGERGECGVVKYEINTVGRSVPAAVNINPVLTAGGGEDASNQQYGNSLAQGVTLT